MTDWLVRTTGSDSNGGTSASVRSTGTDGVTDGTNTLTSASAAWTAADIGHGIYIGGVWRKVTAVGSGTSLTFSGAVIASGTGKTWTIGGAFLTVGKGVTSESLAAGDYVYVGAGTYRISATIAPTSMASMTYCYGDVDGAKTGDAGEVVITTYSTNDTTAASNVVVLTLASKSYWTFRRLSLVSGAAQHGVEVSGTSANITLSDLSIWCVNHGGGFPVMVTPTFGTVVNLVVERCRLSAAPNAWAVYFTCPNAAGTGDINQNITVRNCVLTGYGGVAAVNSGTNTGRKTGGITILNCDITGTVAVFATAALYLSTTYPMKVYNCKIVAQATAQAGLQAGTLGQIVENYNIIVAPTARTNVTAGANSVSNSSYNTRTSQSHEGSYGGVVRPWAEPPAGSPMLTFGGTTVPTDDINGVTRPASGAGQSSTQQALGPYERANSGVKDTGTYRTAAPSLKIAGPGYQDWEIAVGAASTTITAYVRRDASYTGTNPSISVLNGGECGVADATATDAGAASSWNVLTLTFTPTSAGIVTLRFLSSSTAAAGNAWIDDVSVA